MSQILVIAKNTFKETIRDRILYTVTFLGILYILFVFFLATISLDQGRRVLTDFGLVGILFFGIALSVLIGANLLYKEITLGTALILFPKPLSKLQYIIGKFFGLAMMIILISLVLTMIFIFGFLIQNKAWPSLTSYVAITFSILEVLIITALMICFGSFSNPVSSSLYASALFLAGHSLGMIVKTAAQGGNNLLIIVSKFIYYLLPNLEKFNLRANAVYDLAISPREFLFGVIYAAVYITFLLFIAVQAIKRREF